jgi:hypothetical protein
LVEFEGVLPDATGTVMARIRSSATGYQEIVSWDASDGGSSSTQFRLTPTGNLEYGEFGKVWTRVVANPTLNLADGQWHRVSVVRNDWGLVYLFADGRLAGEGIVPPRIPKELEAKARTARVAHGRKPIYIFDGDVTDVRIFSTALSPEHLDRIGLLTCQAAASTTTTKATTTAQRSTSVELAPPTTTTAKLPARAKPPLGRSPPAATRPASLSTTAPGSGGIHFQSKRAGEELLDREAGRVYDVFRRGASYTVLEDVLFAHRGPSKYSRVVGQLIQGQVISGHTEGEWLRLDSDSVRKKLAGTWGPSLEEMEERESSLSINADGRYEGEAWVSAESLRALHPAVCDPPKVLSADGSNCSCPVPQVPDAFGSCKFPEEPPLLTFYMYQAAGDEDGDLENTNLGNLPAVMAYLQEKVVAHCPRLGGISRILRLRISMRTTWKVYRSGNQPQLFAPYASMSACQCTVPNCAAIWQTYGYAPGCLTEAKDNSHAYSGATWYSLPGECPSQSCARKTPECRIQQPGGRCTNPNGTRSCTWHVEPAGEVRLDALTGILDYRAFCASGKKEYVPGLDHGIGAGFWDGQRSRHRCEARIEAVTRLFSKLYPGEPRQSYVAPEC